MVEGEISKNIQNHKPSETLKAGEGNQISRVHF
jgi:hypothetical protein